MTDDRNDFLRLGDCPALDNATLVLSFTGWMDGGNVSTGTVERLVDSAQRAADRPDRSRAVLHLQLPRSDGSGGLVPALCRGRGRRAEEHRHAVEHVLLPRAGAAGAVRRQGAEPELAGLRRLHFPPGEAGGGEADPVRRLVRRIGAAHPRAAAFHFLQRRRDAGRNGALRRAAERLRRAGLVHQFPHVAGPRGRIEDGLA